VEISFFLQNLEIPAEVSDVLGTHWAGSRINSNRWGAKEFFEIVQEMMKNISQGERELIHLNNKK
jgi:hypothetical protein